MHPPFARTPTQRAGRGQSEAIKKQHFARAPILTARRLPVHSPPPPSQAAGNAAFAAGDWRAAIDAFGRAIALDETNHVLFSNRSAALVREHWGGGRARPECSAPALNL